MVMRKLLYIKKVLLPFITFFYIATSYSSISDEMYLSLNKVGISKKQIDTIIQDLGQDNLRETQFNNLIWLKSQGVTKIDKVIEKNPSFIGLRFKRNLQPKINWLKSQGVTKIGKVIETFPALFGLNLEKSLQPKVDWLRSHGVTKIGKIIESNTALLGYNVENNLRPKVDWLKSQGATKIGIIIDLNASILGLSIKNNLQPKVDWLKSQGVADIGKVIDNYPALLGLSLEDNIKPKIKWLKSQGVNNIGKVIDSYPPLLGLSLEGNLMPTMSALFDWGYGPLYLENNTMLLGASLKRFTETYNWLIDAGIDVKNIKNSQKNNIIQRLKLETIINNISILTKIKSEALRDFNLGQKEENIVMELLSSTSGQKVLFKKVLTSTDCNESFSKIVQDFSNL